MHAKTTFAKKRKRGGKETMHSVWIFFLFFSFFFPCRNEDEDTSESSGMTACKEEGNKYARQYHIGIIRGYQEEPFCRMAVGQNLELGQETIFQAH